MASIGKVPDRRTRILTALEQYEGRLTRYAARILGEWEAARDAVQQTFLKLCDEQSDVADERLAAWLYTVCRNAAFDILRRNGRGEKAASDDLPETVGRERDPAVSAEREDVYAGLRALVVQLPTAQREAIDLWIDGFQYRDIARITQRSEGAVRVLVHRALAKIREAPWTRTLMMEDADTSPRAVRELADNSN